MLIALATLMFASILTGALLVIGRELAENGEVMMQALGVDRAKQVVVLPRQFRVIQRRRLTPVRLADERPPYRVAA